MEEQRFGFAELCFSKHFQKSKSSRRKKAEDFSHFSGVHQQVTLFLRKRSHRRLHDIQVEPLGCMQLNVTPQKLSWDQSIVDTLLYPLLEKDQKNVLEL